MTCVAAKSAARAAAVEIREAIGEITRTHMEHPHLGHPFGPEWDEFKGADVEAIQSIILKHIGCGQEAEGGK